MPPNNSEVYVQLERTFHEIHADSKAGDDVELRPVLFSAKPIGWDELLTNHRVVILAEAGAGKTHEIRDAATRLRKEGCPAFFLRIEHISEHFDDAFEVGDLSEFEVWLNSSEDGWLLLDSVDEARLRSPKDFGLAMKTLARRIKTAMQRAHIIVTGRTHAWRPKSDLQLCKQLFPYRPPAATATDQSDDSAQQSISQVSESIKDSFRILALDDLRQRQIEAFLLAKGIENTNDFLSAVERADAWAFTSRPQDLEELAGFWLREHRIGSRLEIIRASIDRRLLERDPDRAESRPLSLERAREGARLIAAATTLARQPLVSIPDGSEESDALALRSILADWTEADCTTLASRPIFDEAVYGTIRFHHRSVREYLTAEWLHCLLLRDRSRRRIEQLFFREQYGIPVVVPSMRPLLPWLVLLDEGIRTRVLRLAPEITFEGGDPTQLPPETRRLILRQVCEQLAQPAHGRSVFDYAAIQRFAAEDIAGDIRALLEQYSEDDQIVGFLLRLIWHGRLRGLAPEAKQFALRAQEKYARIAALRAIISIGSEADISEVRQAILAGSDFIVRDWIDEILKDLGTSGAEIDWLVAALGKVEPKPRFEVDNLARTLGDYINGLPLDPLIRLTRGISALLEIPPLINPQFCQVSERHQWLAPSGTLSIAKLIENRDPAMLGDIFLGMLGKLRRAAEYSLIDMEEARIELATLAKSWPELRRTAFWFNVAQARVERSTGVPISDDLWHAQIVWRDGGFDDGDLEFFLDDVVNRALMDDRRIALKVAFQIYIRSDRPAAWGRRIREATVGQSVLQSDLKMLFHPPAAIPPAWRDDPNTWSMRHALIKARQLGEAEKSKEWLQENLDAVRGLPESALPTPAQAYLRDNMKNDAERNGRWTDGNWQSLIPEFGEEIARSFRDGAVAFWRRSSPVLRSEGATPNSTPLSSILGLIGLAIEAHETTEWASDLSSSQAEIAVRYALEELNGFPRWLPSMYFHHPDVVVGVFLREIEFELRADPQERASPYALYDASWSGQWMWDSLGPALLPELAQKAQTADNLRYILNILQGSSVSDGDLADAAARACAQPIDYTRIAMWFAAWAGVAPEVALSEYESYLATLPEDVDRTNSVLVFATHLLGSRRSGAASRTAFKEVRYLKQVFILLHKFVSRKDDIDRVGRGVYSPGLRDDAQDARDSILTLLAELPGKDAFLALMELSLLHPNDEDRPWMAFHAKAKAAQDADSAPWTVQQFIEFNEVLERTPANHKELWELGLSRLLDLRDELEHGDNSIASILLRVELEEELRNYLGGWLRDRAAARYSVPQEEELADARRPDIRFQGMGFDAPVPVEIKIADKWTGPKLLERLENQLCGDYLRDPRSNRGLFLLIFRGTKSYWDLPDGTRATKPVELVEALQRRWTTISDRYPSVEDIRVVGIDLNERKRSATNA